MIASTFKNSKHLLCFDFIYISIKYFTYLYVYIIHEQVLTYRKQIAPQLRTQYVEGIYDNPVTLKSRLRVIRGHCKRDH